MIALAKKWLQFWPVVIIDSYKDGVTLKYKP